jgi:tetratricopeptide (TPR) repeat protein
MQRNTLFSALAMLALAPAALAIPDADGNLVDPAPDVAEDAAMQARLNYNIGYELVQKTLELELAGTKLKGEPLRDNQEAVRGNYTKARENFRTATAAQPNAKEAWNLLGFTSRKLGDYEASLTAYDKALALAPDYPEAIEYRAELFLMTGRFAQAKEAYAVLLKSSPSYAGVLKTSMKDFLKSGRETSATPADRDAFASWVKTL